MLRNLSPRERDALVELGQRGSGGNFDPIALSKLFTLGLVTVSDDRRVILTDTGRQVWDELKQSN